jgi:hypothetical protein
MPGELVDQGHRQLRVIGQGNTLPKGAAAAGTAVRPVIAAATNQARPFGCSERPLCRRGLVASQRSRKPSLMVRARAFGVELALRYMALSQSTIPLSLSRPVRLSKSTCRQKVP